METEGAPWIEVPYAWLDTEYSSDPEIAKIQRFLDKKVKAEVIRRHLLADGIGKPGELEIAKISVENYKEKCVIESWLNVTGQAWKVKDEATGLFVENKDAGEIKTETVKMIRSLEKDSSGNLLTSHFGKIGVGSAKLPSHFGDEYYLRAIPFLQKIGATSIKSIAGTEADDATRERGRLAGAYVWCRYGFTNPDMEGMKSDFLTYLHEGRKILHEGRKIKLSDSEIDDIRAVKRMIDLADYIIEIRGEKIKIGKDFLLGDDGTGKYSRDVIWQGVIPDINNKSSKEMTELREKLVSQW